MSFFIFKVFFLFFVLTWQQNISGEPVNKSIKYGTKYHVLLRPDDDSLNYVSENTTCEISSKIFNHSSVMTFGDDNHKNSSKVEDITNNQITPLNNGICGITVLNATHDSELEWNVLLRQDNSIVCNKTTKIVITRDTDNGLSSGGSPSEPPSTLAKPAEWTVGIVVGLILIAGIVVFIRKRRKTTIEQVVDRRRQFSEFSSAEVDCNDEI